MIDSRKKFDRESSSKVRKMLGCLKCKYENSIFICRRLIRSEKLIENLKGTECILHVETYNEERITDYISATQIDIQ